MQQQLALREVPIAETGSSAPWIAAGDLALEVLQTKRRLTNDERAALRSFLSAPAPSFEPCSRKHFDACLRTLAVLPRQRDDDVKGELRLALFWRKLGHYSEHQWSLATSCALDNCQWFPTIAEFRKILDKFRSPEARYHSAISLARKALSDDFLAWFRDTARKARSGEVQPEELLHREARVRQLFVDEGVFTAAQMGLP